jgi:hypothetical protein
MDLLSLLLLVEAQAEPSVPAGTRWEQTGLASVYRPGGGGRNGGGLACLERHPSGAHVAPDLPFIAHRRLPCGTVVQLYLPRTRRSTLAVVLDRGPFGAIHSGSWVLKLRASDPGTWRGIADLSPGAAAALEHNGLEPIRLRRVPAPVPLETPLLPPEPISDN